MSFAFSIMQGSLFMNYVINHSDYVLGITHHSNHSPRSPSESDTFFPRTPDQPVVLRGLVLVVVDHVQVEGVVHAPPRPPVPPVEARSWTKFLRERRLRRKILMFECEEEPIPVLRHTWWRGRRCPRRWPWCLPGVWRPSGGGALSHRRLPRTAPTPRIRRPRPRASTTTTPMLRALDHLGNPDILG